jgi:MoxR-like ATPase
MTKKQILDLQTLVQQIYVSEAIYTYVKNLVFATRFPAQAGLEELAQYIDWWVSPRASLALIHCAKVLALMAGRAYVLPEDIKEIAHEVMRHRLVLSFEALASEVTADEIITKILHTVPIVEETEIV